MTDRLDPPPSVGVLRAPDASDDPVVAEMEARVVRNELERRLGPLTLDLRTAGTPVVPWAPRDQAAWPGSIDLVVDLGETIDGVTSTPLIALFGRTVEPEAAAVRTRLLEHLDLMPDHRGFDVAIERLGASPRPTDVWLVARAAGHAGAADSAFGPLLGPDDLIEPIDAWFDAIAARAPAPERADALARALARLDELQRRLEGERADRARTDRELLEHIERLEGELAVLRDRLDRTALDQTSAPAP